MSEGYPEYGVLFMEFATIAKKHHVPVRAQDFCLQASFPNDADQLLAKICGIEPFVESAVNYNCAGSTGQLDWLKSPHRKTLIRARLIQLGHLPK